MKESITPSVSILVDIAKSWCNGKVHVLFKDATSSIDKC